MPAPFNSPRRVVSGTFGKVMIDGDYFAQIYKFQAKTGLNKADIPMANNFVVGKKRMSATNTGSLGMYKIDSSMARKVGLQIQEGLDPNFTAIMELNDPDAHGPERLAFYGVSFDDMTWADWEFNNPSKVECPFTFERCEPLDLMPDD